MPKPQSELIKRDRKISQRAIKIASQVSMSDDPIELLKLQSGLTVLSIASTLDSNSEFNRLIHVADKLS